MSTTPEHTPVATMAGGTIQLTGPSNPGRGYVLTTGGATPSATSPSAGGAIDGVTNEYDADGSMWGIPATSGMPVQVEAGGSVSDGDDLEVDGNGRFETASGGPTGPALEGASFGSFFWAVFT